MQHIKLSYGPVDDLILEALYWTGCCGNTAILENKNVAQGCIDGLYLPTTIYLLFFLLNGTAI